MPFVLFSSDFTDFRGPIRSYSVLKRPLLTIVGTPPRLEKYSLSWILNFSSSDQNHYVSDGNETNNPYVIFHFLKHKMQLESYLLSSHPFKNSNHYMRNWIVYGSNDGYSWKEIHEKRNNDELKEGKKTGFIIENSVGPFSYFKIQMTAKCNFDFAMRIDNIDFYGKLYGSFGYYSQCLCRYSYSFLLLFLMVINK